MQQMRVEIKASESYYYSHTHYVVLLFTCSLLLSNFKILYMVSICISC